MTDLPRPLPGQKKLGLVIDLDLCVGCHACATACKEWNIGGHMAPLPDFHAYEDGAWGVWFNRIHSFEERVEAGGRGRGGRPHRAFPEILPALRGRGLRHGLPDRRLVQARRGRDRAGQ